MSESYYPAHASRPVRVHGAEDLPRRVHEAPPKEHIAGLDIWDNDDRPVLEQWRTWFAPIAEAWSKVECIECELGRQCGRVPMCKGVCPTCCYADCECSP